MRFENGLVVGGLRRHFLEALLELLVLAAPAHPCPASPVADQPARAAARTSKIRPAAIHDGGEFRCISRLHRGDQALHRQLQGEQRLAAVLVQALNLEVQVGAFGRDTARDLELRIECGARQLRQARRRLAAVGERGEKCDVEGVRQSQHVGNQAIVFVQTHDHTLRHGRREQFLRFLQRTRDFPSR